MVRKIITPQHTVVTVHLPETMVGKTVEVLAFEIEEPAEQEETKEAFVKRMDALTENSRVDLSNYRFNRDEANSYDE